MAAWHQTNIPGGHMLAMEAAIADGTVRIFETWEHVYADDPNGEPMLVGSHRTLRTCWLNNVEIGNPETAQWLYGQAVMAP